jgi:hypothetical protein
LAKQNFTAKTQRKLSRKLALGALCVFAVNSLEGAEISLAGGPGAAKVLGSFFHLFFFSTFPFHRLPSPP